jgi:nickel-dependent lactate racemase
MAGYSGSRKSVCPGIAGEETIKGQHRPDLIESTYSKIGNIKNNPFHKLMCEIVSMVPPDFVVNVTLDTKRKITGIIAGNMDKVLIEGIKILEKYVVCKYNSQADIVITSGGGYPLDSTFYQSIKGVVATKDIVKKNGTVIIASSCCDGIGSKEFTDMITAIKSEKEFTEKIKRTYTIDQWQIQELYKVLRKANVYFYSDAINNNTRDKLLVKFTNSIENTLNELAERHNKRMTVAVIPMGPYIIPRIEEK